MRSAVGLFALLLGSPAFAGALSLQEAVSEALERNPQIRLAGARQQQTNAALNEARAMWLPHVDVSETTISSNNPVFVFGSLLEQGRFGASNFDPRFLNAPSALRNYRLALNFRYTIFDQFRRLETTRQASNSAAQSQAGMDEARQAIRLDVTSKFYGLLIAQERRAVAAEAVRSAEADAAAMRQKFQQGLLVESDALAAEVQAASFRQEEIEAAGTVVIARAALNSAIGRDAMDAVTVRGELPDTHVDERPMAALLEQAMKRRGEMTATRLADENAQLQLRIARGSLLPRLDTFASWGASGPTFGSRNGDRTIGAVISFDIFDGGKISRVRQAQAGVDQAGAAGAATRSKVEMEVISAYEHARSARQRIDVARAAVSQSEAAARIVRDRYEQGLTTITEYLHAQTSLVSARLNLLAARYDLAVSSGDLARATGGLNDTSEFE